MDIRDKQFILKNAFAGNGTYAENDTILLRQIQESDKEPYLDIYREKDQWKKLFEMDAKIASEVLWDAFLAADVLNTVIVRQTDNMICGFCGIQQYAELEEPELSLELVPACRHQGIGTMAIPMLMKRFSEITGTRAFISRVFDTNIASLGLVHKLGGVFLRTERDLEWEATANQVSNALNEMQINGFEDALDQFKESIHVFRHIV